jgi:hypothetical protein
MIGNLVIIAIVAAVVGGQAGRRSGKVWAYVTAAAFVTLAVSLLWSGALLLLHPAWDPPPDDLGKYGGRGATIVIGVWLFFNSIGPKGTALIFGAVGLFVANSVRNQLIAIRAGCYEGTDEQERISKKRAEYVALAEKAKALHDANQAELERVRTQRLTFRSQEEAERSAAAINARFADRQREINDYVARAKQLQAELGIPSSSQTKQGAGSAVSSKV